MGNYKLVLTLILVFLITPVIIFAGTDTSTGGNFKTDTPIHLNWSNSFEGPFTLNVTSGTVVLTIQNSSNTVNYNYSQPDSGWGNYGGNPIAADCGLGSNENFDFLVRNNTVYGSVSRNFTGTQEFYLVKDIDCPPGKYWGRINVTNTTADYATAEVFLNIPVSSQSSLNTTTGKGRFAGEMRSSDKTYHSYYFNSTDITNVTSVSISGLSIPVFLFDSSGNYKTENLISSEKLLYQYSPGDLWEVRVFDNTTTGSYSGILAFSTLNITNSSAPSQQFSNIDFGQKNPGDNEVVGVRIRNEGSLEQNTVSESGVIYHTQTASGSGNTNSTFRVPDFATKVYVELSWNGTGNYSVRLYKPDGTSVANSSVNYVGASVSGVEKSVYAEYSGSFGFSNDGMWIVESVNNTDDTPSYDIEFRTHFSPSTWITSDYNTTDFNSTQDYYDYTLNFTVPEKVLSGFYSGRLDYTSSTGSVISLPVEMDIISPEIMVNGTFNTSSVSVNSLIGSNRTITLNITVKNTGNQTLTLSNSSSGFLNSSSYYLDLEYNAPVSLSPGESQTLDITIDVNTTKTGDPSNDRAFTGWIYLSDSSASPYEGFNLSLTVNLKDDLTVRLTDIVTSDGDAIVETPSSSTNITLYNKIFYPDGSVVDDLNATDFDSVTLRGNNSNTESKTYSITTISSAKGQEWQSDHYEINFTLAGSSSRPGGYYNVRLDASRPMGSHTLSGYVTNGTILVQGPGLYFSDETNLDNFEEPNVDQYYNITVTNYGTESVDVANITLDVEGDDAEECDDLLDIDKGETCTSDDIDPGETCTIFWEVDSDDSDYIYECRLDIETDISRIYNTPGSTSFSIEMSSDDGGDDDSGDSGGSDDDDDDDDDEGEIIIASAPSSMTIVQGDNNTYDIDVENAGDTDEDDIELTLTGIESSWYEISPSSLDLDSLEEDDFSLTITVPRDAEVKEYSITFKVENDDVSDTTESKLRVIPCEEEKIEINETCEVLFENYTAIRTRMLEMIGEGKNVTQLNDTLTDAKEKIDEIRDLIADGDYYNAAQKIGQVESLLTVASALTRTTEGLGSGLDVIGGAKNYIWLLVGIVVIVIVGFVAYTFMPQPKSKYQIKKFKYVSPQLYGKSIKDRITKIIKSIKKPNKKKKTKSKKKKRSSPWSKKRK